MNIKGLLNAVRGTFKSALVKPDTNSTTSFQVQDKDGNSAISVDTAHLRLGIGLSNPANVLHMKSALTGISSNVFRMERPDETGAVNPANNDNGAFSLNTATDGRFFWGAYDVGGDKRIIFETAHSFAFAFTSSGTETFRFTIDAKLGIGTAVPKSPLHVVGLPTYANNAAAVAGGLTAGAFYRNNADPDHVCVVH
jgi:hypothetical protein